MDITASEYFYLRQQEPMRGCLITLRDIILQKDTAITEAWKYGMPFFCYQGKMFCYLWVHRKSKQPYLGIVEGKYVHHPDLLQEKRARMKILLVDPHADLPLSDINDVLTQAIAVYTEPKQDLLFRKR